MRVSDFTIYYKCDVGRDTHTLKYVPGTLCMFDPELVAQWVEWPLVWSHEYLMLQGWYPACGIGLGAD